MTREIRIAAAVLAHIRGELATSDLTDMFGVSEADVHNWTDVFQVAGVVALMNALKSGTAPEEDDDWGHWSSPSPRHHRIPPSDPTTGRPGRHRVPASAPTTTAGPPKHLPRRERGR